MTSNSKPRDRGIKELIEIAWAEIDRCLEKLKSDDVKDKHKILWSQNLASFINRLDKMLTKFGVGKLDEESLAKLLEKVPRRYKALILKRVLGRRARTRPVKEP